MTDQEHKWLETVPIGSELEMHGPRGLAKFGCGWVDLERTGFIRVKQDHFGMKIIRLK